VRLSFVMDSKLMRRATMVMPEAAVRVTVVGVVRDSVIRRRRLLRKSDRRRDSRCHAYGKRSDYLKSR
jgi:hypothetical protein